MSRKTRPGEVVCTCPAYAFPHRCTGGKCTAQHIADDYWTAHFGGGDCRNCNSQDDNGCQVVNGAESLDQCPVWQEFVEANEIRLYGAKYR